MPPANHSDADPSRPSAVEQLAAKFFAAKELGETADPEVFAGELGSEPERALFRRIVGAAAQGLRSNGIRPGRVLGGRYTLERKIGFGGMGEVWAALDARLDKKIAVKILNAAASGTFASTDAVKREVRLMHTIGHPGIAPVHDFQVDGDLTYFTMDLVDGVPLSDVIARARGRATKPNGGGLAEIIGRPAPGGQDEVIGNEDWYRSVTRIVIEALRVLEAAHAKGIVHRDLKPNNIMLCGGGRPMILDFGLGRTLDAKTGDLTDGLFGTLHYVAPEQVQNKRAGINPRSDVYQMGAVLYEFLTLRRALDGDSISEVLGNIDHGVVERPRRVDPDLPRELEDICMRALERSPDRRYASALAFRKDLERFLDGTEVPEACRGSLARRARTFARRNRTALAVGLAAVATGLAVFTWMPRLEPIANLRIVGLDYQGAEGERAAAVFRTGFDARTATDVYAMLVIDRDGERLFAPLVDEDERPAQHVEPGTCELTWFTSGSVLRRHDVWEIEHFAATRPGALDSEWQHLLVHAGRIAGPIPADDARAILGELGQRTKSAGGSTPRLDAEMIVGAAQPGRHFHRQRLRGETVP